MACRVVLLLVLVAAGFREPATAQDVVIRNATVHTVTVRGSLKNTDVYVHNGAIAAIGNALSVPSGATSIDAGGKPLTPGLFAGVSTIGIEEVQAEASTDDANTAFKSPAWEQQWRPELDVNLAFNPRSGLIPISRIEGLTWTVLSPNSGDSIVAGQGAAVSFDGQGGAAYPSSRTLFIQMGSDGAHLSGGSRAAAYMLLDQAIQEARSKNAAVPGNLLHAAGREALAHYLAGGRVVFAAQRASDISSIVSFAKSHGIKPIIEGGDEAWLVAGELAQADVPVILDPLDDLPLDFDRLAASLENAARLHKAGVRIIFSSGGDSSKARTIRQRAGIAVAHGLPWDAALAAMTATPAEVFGMNARGHVAVGQSADLVLWSGDPLEVTSVADQVWIAGKAMQMRSRQTELRDRYLQKIKSHQAR